MGYMLGSEYPEPIFTGVRYVEERDTGERNARPFEGSDGRWYGWVRVTNDDGEVFDNEGNVITTYDELRDVGAVAPEGWMDS